MSFRKTPLSYYQTKSFFPALQPAQAWTAILVFLLVTVVLILAGAGKILNLAFPLGTFAVGILLYFRAPILYIGFTWWMFFLTPLVRRLADYRGGGFTDPSPILLGPYLVVILTLITLWKYLPKIHRQGGLPFILSIAGLFFGFLIGLIQLPPISVGIALLEWLVPVLFGFHLFVNWRDYPSYRQNIQRVFIWGVLIMGIYGIFQYMVAPEWDTFWSINSGMISSSGKPVPLNIRVWSTLNSTGPFANVMKAGLLILFTNNKGVLAFAASSAGYIAFLLSLVRAAWLGWFVGLLTLSGSLKANLQMRLIITIMVMAVLVVPLTTIEPFSERINERVETLSNLEEDGSAQGRQAIYRRQIGPALTSFIGEGIGSQKNDSAILDFLLHLGWLGTIFYLGGMLQIMFNLFQGSESRSDIFAATSRAIAFSAVIQMLLGPVMLGVNGMILWGFLGIALAAKKYNLYQFTNKNFQRINSKII